VLPYNTDCDQRLLWRHITLCNYRPIRAADRLNTHNISASNERHSSHLTRRHFRHLRSRRKTTSTQTHTNAVMHYITMHILNYYYYYDYYYYYYYSFFGTIWVSWHQKAQPFRILLQQEMTGWQLHQLDHMQINCTLFQTDNHSVFTGRMPFLPPSQQRQSTEGIY